MATPTGTGAVSTSPLASGIRWLALAIPYLVGVTLISGFIAYCKIFSVFAPWDDEGGLMLTVKHFLDGYPLYDEVYAHHGPFYYLVNWLIFRPTGLQVNHDHFRIITVLMWVTVCLLGSLSVYRMTRDVILAVLVHMVLLSHLSALANEPGHPQGLVCVFSALGVVVSTFYTPARGTAVCLSLGAITGALLLTKANVGGFVLIAPALSFLLPGKPGRVTWALRFLASVAALMLPVVLAKPHLHHPGAQKYVLSATLSLVPILLLGWNQIPAAACRVNGYVSAALACAFTVLLACALVHWHGTSVYGLLHGVVLQHVDFAATFGSVPSVGRRTVVWACAAICLFLCYLRTRGRDGRLAGVVRHGIACIKLAFGVLVLFYSYRFSGSGELVTFFYFATPLLWLGLIPDTARAVPGLDYPRLLLVTLTALLTLQAYPVFGSQIAMGTFLMDLVAALCVRDVLSGTAAVSEASRGAGGDPSGPLSPDLPAAAGAAVASRRPGRPRFRLPQRLRNAAGLRRVGGG
jgi:hypothetical protein